MWQTVDKPSALQCRKLSTFGQLIDHNRPSKFFLTELYSQITINFYDLKNANMIKKTGRLT